MPTPNRILRRARRFAGALALAVCLPASALPSLWSYGAYGYENPALGQSETVFTPGSGTKLASNASFSFMSSLGAPVAQAGVFTPGWFTTNQSNLNATASAAVQYDFLVQTNSVFSEVVPITVRGHYYLFADNEGSASGYVRVAVSNTPGGLPPGGSLQRTNLSFGCSAGSPDCGVLHDFEFNLLIASFGSASPGEIGRLSMLATARIAAQSKYGSSATAWVDPLFEIDPDWAAAHPGASFILGPSVTNALGTPPVPEPGSVALMSLGLVTLLWRRRRAKP
ncbi:PEP-CTERM sorting domain-containing protein [Roseateles paludis]|uniref:PEP-CTERM sorting domain-containing protein n=1 Tax=Roseateles paludis TaxID=3145238 RepID=A0ABV0G1F8_9BURK